MTHDPTYPASSVRKRNAFEVDNARNQTIIEVVSTFIATGTFWRCLTSKHHILVGPRGSGKTVLARILSHSHLSRLELPEVKELVTARAFIGIYVPMRLEWTSALKIKPWEGLKEKEQIFQWRLNVATILAFLDTVQSCLNFYIQDDVQRARREVEFVTRMTPSLLREGIVLSARSMVALAAAVRDAEYSDQVEVAARRLRRDTDVVGAVSPHFAVDLFAPLHNGIRIASDMIGATEETAWLLCLDEAEFLDEDHHRILNSHLRAHTGRVFFKITTMPYRHYTLETNSRAPLNQGEDFDYLYVDQDPVFNVDALGAPRSEGGPAISFARQMFKKRTRLARERYENATLQQIFGTSPLSSPAEQQHFRHQDMRALIPQHCEPKTIARAERLWKTAEAASTAARRRRILLQYEDAIERKLRGALLLREEVSQLGGHTRLRVFSGEQVVVRCSDGNPRQLVRAFNQMMRKARWSKNDRSISVDRATQTAVLAELGELALARAQTEQDIGDQLYALIVAFGWYCHDVLHRRKLSTDVVGSLKVSERDFALYGEILKRAVGRGLLYPNRTGPQEEGLPTGKGDASFRLAYVMAPYFRTLPRRGRSRSIGVIIRYQRLKESLGSTLPLFAGLKEEENGNSADRR